MSHNCRPRLPSLERIPLASVGFLNGPEATRRTVCLSSVPPPNLGCQWWYKAMFSQALSGVLIVSVLLGTSISTSFAQNDDSDFITRSVGIGADVSMNCGQLWGIYCPHMLARKSASSQRVVPPC